MGGLERVDAGCRADRFGVVAGVYLDELVAHLEGEALLCGVQSDFRGAIELLLRW